MTTTPRRTDAAAAPAAASPSFPPSFAEAFPEVHGVILDLIDMTVRGGYPATAEAMRAAITPAPAPVEVPETPAP